MPWEKGVAKKIFSKPALVPKPLQRATVDWVNLEPAEFLSYAVADSDKVQSELDLQGPFFESAIAVISDKTFDEQRQELLSDAVEKWLCILSLRLDASETGRLIGGLLESDQDQSEARRTIGAILGVRSKSTAVVRANAFLKFLRWRETSMHKRDDCVILESDAWAYLEALQELGAAPTRANSFLSACNYAKHVFGFDSLDDICSSRRLRGLADVLYVNKRPLAQAKVLTVEQVEWLHQLLSAPSTHPVDRALAGYTLVALYGRCRHSDLAMIDKVIFDFDKEGGFIEILTRVHKTSRQAAQKTIFLPIVIPAIGVTGVEWITAVQHAFGEACVGPADQAILGRHSSAYAETSAVYSRDASIRAVGKLQGVIAEITAGNFMPDCPRIRSQYRPRNIEGGQEVEDDGWSVVGKSESAEVPTQGEGEIIMILSSDEESESSVESSDSEAEAQPRPRCTRHILSKLTASLFVRHKVSKLVHFKSAEAEAICKVLSCGRSLNGNYEPVSHFDTVDMCKRCRDTAEKAVPL
eukprot:s777_g32.t1